MSCHPFIIAATTADGFIARAKDESSFTWTSREDKQWFRDKTKQAQCAIFGRTTFETFNRPLPNRLNLVYSRSKPDEFAQKTDQELAEARQNNETQLYYTQLSPEEVIQKLGRAGYSQLAVSGGSSVYTQFMKAGVVKKLFLTAEPVLFGTGITLFSEEVPAQLRLVATHELSDQSMVFEYTV